MAGSIIVLLLLLGIAFLVFLIARELVLWYWKVNEILIALKSIDARLASIQGGTGAPSYPSPAPARG